MFYLFYAYNTLSEHTFFYPECDFSASTELSGWMRYDGNYLSGHTTKMFPYVASDMDCWEFCLQEKSFLCTALAYTTRGNRTCLLYNTKTLFHCADWTSAAEMTYYEYCPNGNTKSSQWFLNSSVISISIQQNNKEQTNCWRSLLFRYHLKDINLWIREELESFAEIALTKQK